MREGEVVEIQVGGVERVVQAPSQAKCFDFARKTRERLPILIALAVPDRDPHPFPAFRVDHLDVAIRPWPPISCAKNLHRGYIHVGGGEQPQPASDKFIIIRKSEITKDLACTPHRDHFAAERRREIGLRRRPDRAQTRPAQ